MQQQVVTSGETRQPFLRNVVYTQSQRMGREVGKGLKAEENLKSSRSRKCEWNIVSKRDQKDP